ncbi:hypothetical protein BST37_20255 [Mycobacterium noviomagense]|uniref:Uncharacterized protein n=1 Tax=Mycobacterium noviomagense TaxID=459858 RepID=A0ABX3SZQ0_9MYCO|nr:hypothetical protein BST37_20255 [Mycobacterium noviomagense]
MLKDNGVGALTEIDVQATRKDKLGESMERYVIEAMNTQLMVQFVENPGLWSVAEQATGQLQAAISTLAEEMR